MFIGQLYRDKKKTQFTRVFIQQNLAFALYKCLNLLWRHILLFLSIFLDLLIWVTRHFLDVNTDIFVHLLKVHWNTVNSIEYR